MMLLNAKYKNFFCDDLFCLIVKLFLLSIAGKSAVNVEQSTCIDPWLEWLDMSLNCSGYQLWEFGIDAIELML